MLTKEESARMADHTLWHETLHDQFGQYFAVDNGALS